MLHLLNLYRAHPLPLLTKKMKKHRAQVSQLWNAFKEVDERTTKKVELAHLQIEKKNISTFIDFPRSHDNT